MKSKEGYMDANEIITSITERVRDSANVNVVFGEPFVAEGGVTIIPVASVRLSGGGGGGRGMNKRQQISEGTPAEKDVGVGIGLRVATTPLGYIEVKDGSARFVNITDKTRIAVSGMVLGSAALLFANQTMRLLFWKKRMKRMKMMKWRRHHHHH
jgi:uncharacterized spore protein YtfJ